MTFAPHEPNQTMAEFIGRVGANHAALRELHVGGLPDDLEDGMLWADAATGVVKQRDGSSWLDRWKIGQPLSAASLHVTESYTFGAKVTTGFRPERVVAQVKLVGILGDPFYDDTAVSFFGAEGETVTRRVMTNNSGTLTQVELTCEFHSDGYTIDEDLGTVSILAAGAMATGLTLPAALPAAPAEQTAFGALVSGVDPEAAAAAFNGQAADLRSMHLGPEPPVSPVRFMLWASTTDGYVYQLSATSPALVWTPLWPMGVDRAPYQYSRREIGWATNVGAGFKPRAALLTIEYTKTGVASGSVIKDTRTMLFVETGTGSKAAQLTEAEDAGDNGHVQVDITATFTIDNLSFSRAVNGGAPVGYVESLVPIGVEVFA